MFDIRNITEDEAKKQLEYLAKEIEKADIAYYQMMHHTLTMPLMTSCAA